MNKPRTLLAGTGVILCFAGAALAQTQGVTDTEIVIGTHTALTGPVASGGLASTNAVRLRFEQENQKGGVHGRKIRYIVEDHGYQVPRAVQAGNKLLTRDRIFAMVVALGTPMNLAVLQRQLEMNVVNFGPFTVARSMTEPLHKLKFGVYSSYYDQIRAGLKYFVEKKGKKTPCVMYVDNEGGQEMLEGARDQAKAMKLALAAESAHKPTDTDFTGAITKLREAKCDLVLMGTIVRDTIIAYSTARKLGWDATFVGSVATYGGAVASAAGGITDGYFAMTSQPVVYSDEASGRAKEFMEAYRARYKQDASGLEQGAYVIADIFVEALRRAGKDLTMDSLVKALESIDSYANPFADGTISFSATKHLGFDQVFLAVVEGGRWKTLEKGLKYK
jgi:branched-chain amino acid transport system substrate-binding protein